MLLIIGDSFAFHLRAQLDPAWRVTCVGRRGANLSDDSFRKWAIETAIDIRPTRVLIIAGGNDLAKPQFRHQSMVALFEEISLGLLAAGADQVRILAIPPRVVMRKDDVTAACYNRRRYIINGKLRNKFKRDPVVFRYMCTSKGFLGRDGVHPSSQGWQILRTVVCSLM